MSFEDEILIPDDENNLLPEKIINELPDEILERYYEEIEDYESVRLEVFRNKRKGGQFAGLVPLGSFSASNFPIYAEDLAGRFGSGEVLLQFSHFVDGKKSYYFDGNAKKLLLILEKFEFESVKNFSNNDFKEDLRLERERNNMLVEHILETNKTMAQALAVSKSYVARNNTVTMLREFAALKRGLSDFSVGGEKSTFSRALSIADKALTAFTEDDEKDDDEVDEKILDNGNVEASSENVFSDEAFFTKEENDLENEIENLKKELK